MTSLKTIRVNRRVGSLFAVAALVLATVTPGLVPAFASAAQLTERSVQLSSSSKSATNVSYEATFTPSAIAGAVVFDFCDESPLIGSACTLPAGFSSETASTSTSGFVVTETAAATKHTVKAVGSLPAEATTITLTGINNPSDAGPLYVRILTFADDTAADAYVSATPTSYKDTVIDQGAAAVSITDTVGVSAAVLETMTFCVSGATIADGCVDASEAAIEIGELTGSVRALSAGVVSTGSIYSQLSTNAASGAVVNMKSSATDCGGLLLNGDVENGCHIGPATTDVDGSAALFGLKVTPVAGGTGAFDAASSGVFYNSSAFKINFASGNASGVTGPYGDPILDTAGAPTSNKNAQITFGASIANDTPAGLYSADFSLIATGKF